MSTPIIAHIDSVISCTVCCMPLTTFFTFSLQILMSVPLVMVAVHTHVSMLSEPTTALVMLGTGWAMRVEDAMVSK